jgi:hypothetical protein
LNEVAMLAGWHTPHCPRKNDSDNSASTYLERQVLAEWGTPRVTTNGGHGNPDRATDGKARLEDQVHGVVSTSCPAGTGKRGVLNPNMSRWLMGLPLSWTLCGMLAFLKTRARRRSAPSRSSSTESGA